MSLTHTIEVGFAPVGVKVSSYRVVVMGLPLVAQNTDAAGASGYLAELTSLFVSSIAERMLSS